MKTSFSARSGLAIVGLLAAAGLAACGGGGGSTTSIPAAVTQPTTNGNVPISSLDVMRPAATTAVNVTSSRPPSGTIDVADRATVALSAPNGGIAGITDTSQHSFTGTLRGQSTASKRRAASSVALNSVLDLTYHGGVVVGSAASHNIFVNCDATCRANNNFNPGLFINNLNNDQFITLHYQYMNGPGVVDSTPVTGRFPKGLGGEITPTYASPRPGSTNPYYGQLSILLAVLNAAPTLGAPSDGSGYGHIYHVYLPKNVDTCFESPLGTPTTTCYSPDNGATFFFCAYHGSFTSSGKVYLYTVEPYQDVNGCRNQIYNQGPLPNAVSPTVDPADPGYSTLSHELFETISDPRGNAWWNNFSGGEEIGDLCADFDNFVTINGTQYVLQSEYSDVNHLCVSGNLTGAAQTPQTAGRSVH